MTLQFRRRHRPIAIGVRPHHADRQPPPPAGRRSRRHNRNLCRTDRPIRIQIRPLQPVQRHGTRRRPLQGHRVIQARLVNRNPIAKARDQGCHLLQIHGRVGDHRLRQGLRQRARQTRNRQGKGA